MEAAPSAAGCSLSRGYTACAIRRAEIAAPPPAAASASASASASSSSSSTTCGAGYDFSSSSAHVVEQCIHLRSLTGKNETLAIYLFMVHSTAEISYEL